MFHSMPSSGEHVGGWQWCLFQRRKRGHRFEEEMVAAFAIRQFLDKSHEVLDVPLVGCHVQYEQIWKSPPRLVNRSCDDLAILENFSQEAALSEVAAEHRLRVSIGFESEKAIPFISVHPVLDAEERVRD